MEYLKLTDGTVTVKVQDQTNLEHADWDYQIVAKVGSKHFVEVNSRTNLQGAISEAEVYRVHQAGHGS
jgi:hypothetical protein